MNLNDLTRGWCQAHPWTLGYVLAVVLAELILLIATNWKG